MEQNTLISNRAKRLLYLHYNCLLVTLICCMHYTNNILKDSLRSQHWKCKVVLPVIKKKKGKTCHQLVQLLL